MTNNPPMVSVIVPVYNVEKYLRRCLDSILCQTYTDWECLLVDDGSTDRSGEILDEYVEKDKRFTVFHKANGGVTSARNVGLNNSKGKWIMNIDGDDWIEPDGVEQLLITAERTESDVVIGDFKFNYENGNETVAYKNIDWTDDKISSLNNYISSVWTTLWAGIAKRAIYTSQNLKSPSEITYCEDFHLMTRLCWFAKKVSNCHYAFYNYRQQPTSVMHNLNKKTEFDEQWAYLDTIKFFKEQDAYEYLRRTLNWRLLKSVQGLVLIPSEHERFVELCHASGSEIWSCPFINRKTKIMAWLLVHHFRPIVVLIDNVRILLNR